LFTYPRDKGVYVFVIVEKDSSSAVKAAEKLGKLTEIFDGPLTQ